MMNRIEERNFALESAKAYWDQNPDLKDLPNTYYCAQCNLPILDKVGTSLLGGWMRCAACTERKFPVQQTAETIYVSRTNHPEKKSKKS